MKMKENTIESNKKRAQKQQMQITTCQTNTRIRNE
jgi:hypothetical protein